MPELDASKSVRVWAFFETEWRRESIERVAIAAGGSANPLALGQLRD